jgi:polysaccharide deacetylase family protein (PEP-CTERM system associated)
MLGDRTVDPLPAGEPAFAMTVDVEDWFHANWRSAPASFDPAGLPRRVEAGVELVLELLAAADARATFFVLGSVAREHPQLVGRIAGAGHEIGCHGMTHTLVYEERPDAFARAVAEARALLVEQSGQPVWGFRAPSWSVTERSVWAFDALAAAGFRYDSSVFPAANYLYGVDGAPRAPYRVPTRPAGAVIEVPPPVVAFAGRRLGVGGGFYLRLLPLWVHRRTLARYARDGAPFLLYVHPRELDPEAWALGVPLALKERLIRDVGLGAVRRRIAHLLAEHRWEPVADVLRRRGAFG